MKTLIPNVLERLDPHGRALPVVFDSPHSGNIYPADFEHALERELLRRAEDAFVDELYAAAPHHGATLLRALFPRSYIDPNRRSDDIDESLLAEPWPHPLQPGPKVKLGIGLIRKKEVAGHIYDRKLYVEEIQRRIKTYYQPYHSELAATFRRFHRDFGSVWHVNCHSMRSVSGGISPEGSGKKRSDFCVGDRDSTSCAGEFTELVVETLRAMGYRVAVNKPYKGVELVDKYSDPDRNRHSLQIEVRRNLYMDETTIQPNAGFMKLKADLTRLIEVICEFARSRC
jgi:N-formylglutamate amidohydrolase